MKANQFYSLCSAVYSGGALLLLFMTDVSYLAEKSKFSFLIGVFAGMEFFKYFILLTQFPDIFKSLGSSFASFSYSTHKNNSDKRLKQILKGIILMVIMTTIYHITIVLLGAGVIENFEETLSLSMLLCVLTFLPLCLYFGPHSALGALFNGYPSHITVFEAALRQTVFVTLFGTWVGAFVIPLDWDRPWQKWPIPCAVGSILGYFVSNIIKMPSPQASKYSV